MKNEKTFGGGVFKLLNRNIKDFNKIILSLGCISFLSLMGLLSYKISSSYAYFTNSVTGNNIIEMTYEKQNLDKSGANVPVLSDNMIPVYYDEASKVWKKADSKNSKEEYKWYDYDNKMWANAVTVTETNRNTYLNASLGTEIPMSDINTMWVWIPRYTYTYFSSSTPVEINIKFEKGTNSSGTISCTDTVEATSSTSETCTDSKNESFIIGTSTYTHPAFWWDKNDNSVRESGEELTGIWVGKFEISSEQVIKPNVTSLREINISTFYNNIYNMRNGGNSFGFSTSDEVHMIKNMEWGAVTYLSHSKYGTCINETCEDVEPNSYNGYVTGCGPQSSNSTLSGGLCNEYNTDLGKQASTTGNIYGIYDMSGGAEEYVMGNVAYSSDSMRSGSSGFSTYPNKRYYDKYSQGTDMKTDYERGKLGDATEEMQPVSNTQRSWYYVYVNFPYSSWPWFARGDSWNGSPSLFSFSYGIGAGVSINSTRAVISNLT